MQRLALQPRRLERGAHGRGGRPRAVDGGAQAGRAAGGEVQADLVGAPGLQLAGHPRRQRPGRGPEAALDPVVRHRLAPAVAQHRHLLAVVRRAADPPGDDARRRVRSAADQGCVATLDVVGGEARREPPVRPVGLGRDHDAGGVLVQPVHDPRPLHPADP